MTWTFRVRRHGKKIYRIVTMNTLWLGIWGMEQAFFESWVDIDRTHSNELRPSLSFLLWIRGKDSESFVSYSKFMTCWMSSIGCKTLGSLGGCLKYLTCSRLSVEGMESRSLGGQLFETLPTSHLLQVVSLKSFLKLPLSLRYTPYSL